MHIYSDIFFPHFYLTYVLTFYLAVFLASILTSYVRVQACPTASGARDVGSIADHSSDKMAGEETRREEEEEENGRWEIKKNEIPSSFEHTHIFLQ